MTEPGRVIELRKDIYQIRSERPGSHIYLINGQTKRMLIDTGMTNGFSFLKDGLGQIGLKPEDINFIILTHEHFDHIGATTFFFKTAIVAAHHLTANKIELQDEFVTMNKYYNVPTDFFHADIWLGDDTLIELGNYRLRALHTPGHTSGCICLYEPDHKLLFTGDTVLAGGTLSGIFASGNISDYMHSLEHLSSLVVDELYPGHGRISLTPRQDICQAVEHARDLLEESKALFEALDTKSTLQHLLAAIRKFPPQR